MFIFHISYFIFSTPDGRKSSRVAWNPLHRNRNRHQQNQTVWIQVLQRPEWVITSSFFLLVSFSLMDLLRQVPREYSQ
ncbi:hypothetical protein EYF80_036971 [Liparis tanakae]|uniref:Uncharacterized protein n=1 Tax=Liparis tanakae TaxID=230148 RepID=A0A4Z2GI63_9TELE|nr:hypothetical protein EYF80_036971 [Liparis tanakae]